MSLDPTRLHRLRRTAALRAMVNETELRPTDLIMPIFAAKGADRCEPLIAIPGVNLLAGAALAREAEAIARAGVPAVLVFGVIDSDSKDASASHAVRPGNTVCEAIGRIKNQRPELIVIADLCLCEYTEHSHCGILRDGRIDNDATVAVLTEAAVVLARAGADIIAPSGVMDGVVGALRRALDAAGLTHVALMPYSAKFASEFYGPFKVASQSAPQESQHATHQIQLGNSREALRKIAVDVAEGADLVIVKPALTSLDVLALARETVPVPLAGYDVSGFHAMLAQHCGTDEALRRLLTREVLTCIRRAGAKLIITYSAKDIAPYL
jgi:porphobilinogen synthase